MAGLGAFDVWSEAGLALAFCVAAQVIPRALSHKDLVPPQIHGLSNGEKSDHPKGLVGVN